MVESTDDEKDDEDTGGRRPTKRAKAGPAPRLLARGKVGGGRKLTAGQGLAAMSEGVRALSRSSPPPSAWRPQRTRLTSRVSRLNDASRRQCLERSSGSFRRNYKLAATYLTVRNTPAEDRQVTVDMAIEDATLSPL